MKEQVKDILPSFLLASIMAVIVYLISWIPLADIYILIIQIVTGAVIVFGYCELKGLDEYYKAKSAALQLIDKYKGKGNEQ